MLKGGGVTRSPDVSILFSKLISPLSCSLSQQSEEILIPKDSTAYRIYGSALVHEMYNCSCSLNEQCTALFEDSDMRAVGFSPDGQIRMVELTSHRFFFAVLYQPQLNKASAPHPIINSFLKAADGNKNVCSLSTAEKK